MVRAGIAARCSGFGACAAALALSLGLFADKGLGQSTRPLPADCSLPASPCTLAETAAQAGVWIGAAISDPDAAAEQATVPRHFNAFTAENAMKWGSLAPLVGHYDFSRADALVEFAQRTGARLRGHTLVWRDQQPADLKEQVESSPDPPARMREWMTEHIRTVVGRYRGKVAIWDVVNEPLNVSAGSLDNNLFRRTLGDGYIAEAFRLAHEADPGALLFLNEFLLGYSGSKARGLVSLVRNLLEQGVHLDGVGIQAHFFPAFALPSRTQFEAYLRSIADLGVRVELTELDVSMEHFRGAPDPLARQAEFYGDAVAACMAVPGCGGVTVWGIEDGDTWLDGVEPFSAAAPNLPLLFDAGLRPKPAYFAVRDALATRAPRFFDCNGDRRVTVEELVRGVAIALGSEPASACAVFDVDGDGAVTVDEITAAVAAALAD